MRFPFGLSQGPDFFIQLIYKTFGLNKTSNQSQGSGYLAYLDDILIYSKTQKERECRFLILFSFNCKVELCSKSQETENKGLRGNTNPIKRRTYITVPYIKGLGESVKNTCKKYGIQVFFKGGKTIKDLLMAPKDRDLITQKSGIIYRYKCDRVECDDEYIGKSARTFGERFKEHLKHPFPIHDQNTITGHDTTIDNFSIVGREDHNLMRLIKEAIYIRVNNRSLNKNIGKYHLPHVWDEVLNNITELKLK